MKKRELTALSLTLLLTAALFTGCGSGNEDQGQSGAEMQEVQENAESPAPTGEEENAPQEEQDSEAQSTVPVENLKATGFEYDREALTYELVWSDEFDYEGLPDSEKWGYDTGGNGWGNHELQYYTKDGNASVKDGVLVIEARKEEIQGKTRYTSARLVTRNKAAWTYCKVDVYAKLPSGLGTWPAIWMLSAGNTYGVWPASGEVDIMEHVGYDQDVIVQTVHNLKYYGGDGKGNSVRIDGVSEDFHLYSLEWLPDRLIFSVDGEERYTYDPHDYTDQPTFVHWPYDKPMYLLLNLAFGGDWGGAKGVDDSYFPVQFEVDYVRVYQSPEIMEMTGQTMPETAGDGTEQSSEDSESSDQEAQEESTEQSDSAE